MRTRWATAWMSWIERLITWVPNSKECKRKKKKIEKRPIWSKFNCQHANEAARPRTAEATTSVSVWCDWKRAKNVLIRARNQRHETIERGGQTNIRNTVLCKESSKASTSINSESKKSRIGTEKGIVSMQNTVRQVQKKSKVMGRVQWKRKVYKKCIENRMCRFKMLFEREKIEVATGVQSVWMQIEKRKRAAK